MIGVIGEGLTTVIGWVGEVVTSLVTTGGDLNPLLALFGVGIAVSAFFMGMKAIRSVTWGA